MIKLPQGPDARGWIGISVFALTVMVLWMVAVFPELRKDEFFKVLATAIVLTGFIQGVVGWAYSATKSGGELADKNAAIVHESAAAAVATAATLAATVAPAAEPQKVEVVNTPAAPVPTSIESPSEQEAEIPEYAR